jgi:hypothetical protein
MKRWKWGIGSHLWEDLILKRRNFQLFFYGEVIYFKRGNLLNDGEELKQSSDVNPTKVIIQVINGEKLAYTKI